MKPTLRTHLGQILQRFGATLTGKSADWTRPLLASEEDSSSAPQLLTNAAQQSVWVYSCVRALGENTANVPFRISRGKRGGEDLVESGPLATLLHRPHSQLSRFDFWELLVSWLMLRGEACVAPVDDSGAAVNLDRPASGLREIRRLVILAPDRMRRVIEGGELIGWHYTPGPDSPRAGSDFLPGEIISLRLPQIDHFWEGLAPAAVAQLAAQTDFSSAQFMKGLLRNNGDAGVIVATEQTLMPEQREQILAGLRARKRSAGLADRPLILEHGLQLSKPGLTSADLQFLENRRFNRQEICAVFGVPQEVLGFSEDANRSVGESARLNFIENRIVPLCARLEAAFEPLVKHFGRDLYGWFDFDALPVMQAARRARLDTARKAWEMGVPLNELNRVYDLGFPSFSWGETPYVSRNVQTTEAAAKQTSPTSL